MERGKSDAIHFYSAIHQRKKTMDLPPQRSKILSNWEQVLSFVLHPKRVSHTNRDPNNRTQSRNPCPHQSLAPSGCHHVKGLLCAKSIGKSHISRFARQVHQDRQNGSRNPIGKAIGPRKGRRRGWADLVVGMPLQRRSPQERAPLWSQE
jgi:hypothetical protein